MPGGNSSASLLGAGPRILSIPLSVTAASIAAPAVAVVLGIGTGKTAVAVEVVILVGEPVLVRSVVIEVIRKVVPVGGSRADAFSTAGVGIPEFHLLTKTHDIAAHGIQGGVDELGGHLSESGAGLTSDVSAHRREIVAHKSGAPAELGAFVAVEVVSVLSVAELVAPTSERSITAAKVVIISSTELIITVSEGVVTPTKRRAAVAAGIKPPVVVRIEASVAAGIEAPIAAGIEPPVGVGIEAPVSELVVSAESVRVGATTSPGLIVTVKAPVGESLVVVSASRGWEGAKVVVRRPHRSRAHSLTPDFGKQGLHEIVADILHETVESRRI